MKQQTFLVYRIYDADGVFYVGRTSQPLKTRMRQHMASTNNGSEIPHIDPKTVKRIEFALCASEADMYLYEVYYINKLHPQMNVDAKASDFLTVQLPELKWHGYQFYREMKNWEMLYANAEMDERINRQKMNHLDKLIAEYDDKFSAGLITREEHLALIEQSKQIYGV